MVNLTCNCCGCPVKIVVHIGQMPEMVTTISYTLLTTLNDGHKTKGDNGQSSMDLSMYN